MTDLRRGKPRRIRQRVGMVNMRRAADHATYVAGRISDWEQQVRADERLRLSRDGWMAPEQHEAVVAVAKVRARNGERKRIARAIDRAADAAHEVAERTGHDWDDGFEAGLLRAMHIAERGGE